MIKKYSLIILQKAINHALALDENSGQKMDSLDGKTIEIIVAPLDVTFFIRFEQQQLLLLDRTSEPVDTSIYSSPLGLIRLSFLPASEARSLFNNKVRFSGDVDVGVRVKKLFDSLDIDWEGHLAEFTGDVVAYQIGSLVKKGLSFTSQVHHSLVQNSTDYIQEEARLSPGREEVADLFTDIDTLSHDVARLEATLALALASTADNADTAS